MYEKRTKFEWFFVCHCNLSSPTKMCAQLLNWPHLPRFLSFSKCFIFLFVFVSFWLPRLRFLGFYVWSYAIAVSLAVFPLSFFSELRWKLIGMSFRPFWPLRVCFTGSALKHSNGSPMIQRTNCYETNKKSYQTKIWVQRINVKYILGRLYVTSNYFTCIV